VRGRNADKILTHNLTRAAFDKDVAMEAKSFKAERIATAADAPRAIAEGDKGSTSKAKVR